MIEVLKDKTGCLEVTAFDDVVQFNDVGVVESFEKMVLSFDFCGLNGKQYLNGDFLFVFLIATLEHVGIPASANLVGNGVLFELSALDECYPQGKSMSS